METKLLNALTIRNWRQRLEKRAYESYVVAQENTAAAQADYDAAVTDLTIQKTKETE